MTQLSSKPAITKPVPTKIEVTDTGNIRLGGGFRLPTPEIADNGRIRLGGGFRLPAG